MNNKPFNAIAISWTMPLAILAFCMLATPAQADFNFVHSGSNDPSTEGISAIVNLGAPSVGAPLANDLGYASWSITNSDVTSQSGYGGPLFSAVQTDIESQGLRINMTARPIQHLAPLSQTPGQVIGIVDTFFQIGGRRFDILVGLNTAGDTVVGLPTSLSESDSLLIGEGPTYTLAGQGNGYHTYSLLYDPASQLAELFIDGIQRFDGYGGSPYFEFDYPVGGFAAINGGQANFNYLQFTSVPEPSSLALLSFGGAAAIGVLIRRRRS